MKSFMYRIRNGKAYSTEREEYTLEQKRKAKQVYNRVMNSIVKDVEKNVRGKRIYIPEYINYTLPATEKQFIGYFPSGTSISIPKEMIFGIHWANVNTHRIDLDLSLINCDGDKFGWDGSYRDNERSILFSGDMTDAPKPKGATELFYVRRQETNAYILYVNYYNHNEKVEVPFKILVGKGHPGVFSKNYMISPNNVLSIAKSTITEPQKILGLVVTTLGECRFYFTETGIGKSITSSNSEYSKHSRKYLFDFYKNAISLKDLLFRAGAKLVTDNKRCDIDLSPEKIDKESILNLIKK